MVKICLDKVGYLSNTVGKLDHEYDRKVAECYENKWCRLSKNTYILKYWSIVFATYGLLNVTTEMRCFAPNCAF